MRNFSSVRYFGLLILFALLLQGCASGWMQQRFDYLNKVAVKAHAERDTIMHHAKTMFSNQQVSITESLSDSVFENTVVSKATTLKNAVSFARNESSRILRSHPSLMRKVQSHSSMASAEQENGIFLFLLLFFGSLVLFTALLFWAIGEQKGCLAAAIAVIGLLFEISLFIFALDSMV